MKAPTGITVLQTVALIHWAIGTISRVRICTSHDITIDLL